MKTKQQICIPVISAGIFAACHTGQKETGECTIDSLVLERVTYNHPDRSREKEPAGFLCGWVCKINGAGDRVSELLIGAL